MSEETQGMGAKRWIFGAKSNLMQKNFLLRFSIPNFPASSPFFFVASFFLIAPFIRKTHACICASLHRNKPFEYFGVDTQYILFSHKKMDGNHHSVREKSVGFTSHTTTHHRRRRYFQLLHETSLRSSRPPNHPTNTHSSSLAPISSDFVPISSMRLLCEDKINSLAKQNEINFTMSLHVKLATLLFSLPRQATHPTREHYRLAHVFKNVVRVLESLSRA